VEDVIRQANSFAKQFIVRNITEFVKICQIRRAVAEAAGAVNHAVDTLTIGRLGETAPRASGVHQTSNCGGAVNVLQRRVAEPVTAQHTQRVDCLRTAAG